MHHADVGSAGDLNDYDAYVRTHVLGSDDNNMCRMTVLAAANSDISMCLTGRLQPQAHPHCH